MNKNWVYIASGAGVLTATMVILAVVRKRARKKEAKKEREKEVPFEVPEEKPSLSKLSIGKKIYTKTDNTQLRTSAKINNGWINNIGVTVQRANTYVGALKNITVPDLDYINPATMKPYVWAIFNYEANPEKELYVREDVIILK